MRGWQNSDDDWASALFEAQACLAGGATPPHAAGRSPASNHTWLVYSRFDALGPWGLVPWPGVCDRERLTPDTWSPGSWRYLFTSLPLTSHTSRAKAGRAPPGQFFFLPFLSRAEAEP